ncbi:MAG TPA: AraC family transcriptional regulator, partial [Actinobacteria bacterium]|nr:AraC family transcriptional regulator [Actinomycetota bacterium]
MNIEDTEACYRAVKSRDRRFDGVFFGAVTTTGIYCRPSCPAMTPQQKNMRFYRTAAAAQAAGFRACKRCLPDATPGSPDWDSAADVTGRAMRLISDGVVEREGVDGLASRVGYTSRHLTRVLSAQLGAGPLALARAKRAQTARILIETTGMPFAEVTYAAGFASIRQFNDTIREVYAATPSQLRGRGHGERVSGVLELRLPVRAPFAAPELFAFLRARAVRLVEQGGPDWYARTLTLPHGSGRVRLSMTPVAPRSTQFVACSLEVSDLRDVSAAVERCRRLVDADCDPVVVEDALAVDPLLARLVRRRPGLRVPGHVDGDELAVRAVMGQQISVAGAATVAARLTERYGARLPTSTSFEGLDRAFPTAGSLAEADPAELPMPTARGRALTTLCAALAAGEIRLDRGGERAEVRARLLALPGIGPWTASYIAMRALGDPDVFMPTDVGVRHAFTRLGLDP